MTGWLLERAEQLNALYALLALAGGAVSWLLKMLFADRRTAASVLSSLKTIQSDVAALNRRVAGQIARARDEFNRDRVPRFETDVLGNIVDVNQALLDLVDLPLERLLGRGWEGCIHVEDRVFVIKEIDRAVDAKRFAILDFRLVSGDGVWNSGRVDVVHHVRCVFAPLICEAHVITGFSGRYYEEAAPPPILLTH